MQWRRNTFTDVLGQFWCISFNFCHFLFVTSMICYAIINAAPSPEIMTTLYTVYWSMLITDVICIKWNQAAWIKSYSVKWILVSYDSGTTFFNDYCTHFTNLPLKMIRSRIKIVISWGHINWICALPSLRINTQHWVHLKGSYWRWKLLSHDASRCEYTTEFLLVKLIRNSVSWKWILVETSMLTQRYPLEKTLQSVCVFVCVFELGVGCVLEEILIYFYILRAIWTSLIYLWES